MSRTAVRTRGIHRTIHLVAGGVLGAFVYSPLRDVAWFQVVTQAAAVPTVTITGLWLWKGHAVKSWLGGKSRAATVPQDTTVGVWAPDAGGRGRASSRDHPTTRRVPRGAP
jgi:hypothetical protein